MIPAEYKVHSHWNYWSQQYYFRTYKYVKEDSANYIIKQQAVCNDFERQSYIYICINKCMVNLRTSTKCHVNPVSPCYGPR